MMNYLLLEVNLRIITQPWYKDYEILIGLENEKHSKVTEMKIDTNTCN